MTDCNPHIRLWTAAELADAHTGRDPWLATRLLNANGLSRKMARAYPYNLRHTYIVFFDEGEAVTIHATDTSMALAFANAVYVDIVAISEIVTTYTTVWERAS